MDITSIKIDTKTRDRLKHVCLKDETYADKINDFLDNLENRNDQ